MSNSCRCIRSQICDSCRRKAHVSGHDVKKHGGGWWYYNSQDRRSSRDDTESLWGDWDDPNKIPDEIS